MGNIQPYRVSGRHPRSDDTPRSAHLALRVGTIAFATSALLSLVVGISHSSARGLSRTELVVRQLTAAGTLAFFAWRAVPRTRSHVLARIALAALVVGAASSHIAAGQLTADACQPRGPIAGASGVFGIVPMITRPIVWGGLLLVVRAAGRDRVSTWWPALVGATVATTMNFTPLWIFDDPLLADWGTVSLGTGAIVGALTFALFSHAFAKIARDLRQTPPLEETLASFHFDELPKDARARANEWRAASLALTVAVALSISCAAETLTALEPFGGTSFIRSSRASALLTIVFVAAFARWRLRCTGASSAIVVAMVLTALFAVISAFASEQVTTGAITRCAAILCASVAVAGFGMFLPSLGRSLERRLRAIAGQVIIGGILLGASAIASMVWSHPALHPCLAVASVAFLVRAMAASRPLDRDARLVDLASKQADRSNVDQ